MPLVFQWTWELAVHQVKPMSAQHGVIVASLSPLVPNARESSPPSWISCSMTGQPIHWRVCGGSSSDP
jgi:hypothetical protein